MKINTPEISLEVSSEKIVIGKVFSFVENFFSDVLVYVNKDLGRARFKDEFLNIKLGTIKFFVKRA